MGPKGPAYTLMEMTAKVFVRGKTKVKTEFLLSSALSLSLMIFDVDFISAYTATLSCGKKDPKFIDS